MATPVRKSPNAIPKANGASDDATTERQIKFKMLANGIREMGLLESIHITPYVREDIPYFSALPEDQQQTVLKSIEATLEAGRQLLATGGALRDTRKLTWLVMKHMQLTPSSGIIEMVEPGDFVDIHNLHHQMIFASPRFFDLISYSLEDLYCRTWMDLYERPVNIQEMLFQQAADLLTGKNFDTVLLDIPEHEASERATTARQTSIVKPKVFSAIFENGRPAGFLTINQLIDGPWPRKVN